jgi:hypothetical protein
VQHCDEKSKRSIKSQTCKFLLNEEKILRNLIVALINKKKVPRGHHDETGKELEAIHDRCRRVNRVSLFENSFEFSANI